MQLLTAQDVAKKQLEILKVVDLWCREHDVKYFLAYGTLLGAVRHQGYIPWDDDIDIVMFRPDYERFIKEFNQKENDATIKVLHSSIDKNFPYEFSKVCDFSTKIVENTDVVYDIGINLDLFALDSIDPDTAEMREMLKATKLPKEVLKWKHVLSNRSRKEQGQPRTGIKKVAVPMIKAVCNCISMYWCTAKINKEAKAASNVNARWVADICQRWFKPNQVMRKEWFEEETELEFEGCKFKAPAHYDEVLSVWYGDYMKLPPKEEQVTHHDYKAYLR